MEITVSQHQARVPVTVFHITGDIDTNSYEQLEAQALQAIQNGTRDLVLDLSNVKYISSYGIRGISDIFNRLRLHSKAADEELSKGLRDGKSKACHLKLASPAPQVNRTLMQAGMDMFLEIHGDVKKAVDSF